MSREYKAVIAESYTKSSRCTLEKVQVKQNKNAVGPEYREAHISESKLAPFSRYHTLYVT